MSRNIFHLITEFQCTVDAKVVSKSGGGSQKSAWELDCLWATPMATMSIKAYVTKYGDFLWAICPTLPPKSSERCGGSLSKMLEDKYVSMGQLSKSSVRKTIFVLHSISLFFSASFKKLCWAIENVSQPNFRVYCIVYKLDRHDHA